MPRPLASALATFLGVAVLGIAPQRALAFGHLWEITELYSNADGSVQFIELHSEFPAENRLTGTFLRSAANGQHYNFATDLTGSTLDRHLLVATAAFAAQPGAVTPDYVMSDSFIRINGDTIGFWTDGDLYFPAQLWDSLPFGGATPLPVDAILALARDHETGVIAAAVNSPTNFSGQTGSLAVPEPGSAQLLAFAVAALALFRDAARSRP